MKCTIPEISWHNRDPILSIDIQPVYNEEFYRLASGGTDCHVLIWYLKIRKNGALDVDVVSDLKRHSRAVNVVRWSPSGRYLATGDDEASIIIWNLKTDNIPLLEGETSDKETWLVNKILRGHKEDVYDICWSPNGLKLISGSIDNTAILWDFSKGLNECILTDHKGFVQGVTWDPKGQYIATLCSDRVCRVFDSTGKHVKSRAHKGILPLPESHVLFNKDVKYFHDDTFKSYFRRLSFTPDGNLLIAPSGCIESEDYNVRHTTLVFTLDCLTQPAAVLPNPKQETIAVRCCPILFELHSEGTDPIIDLPYRMVIAVATDSDVVLYDTQQLVPFAHLQKIHYTRITDLTWSSDGLLLIASSTDGYCTLVTFEPNELGIQYVKEESEAEESFLDISGCEELDKTETSNKKNKEKEQVEIKSKKPNLLEQWAIRKPKGDVLKEDNAQNVTKGKNNVLQEKVALTDQEPMDADKSGATVQRKEPRKVVPKRIVPIKIADIQKGQKPEKSCTNVVNNNEEKKAVTHTNIDNIEKENKTDKIIKHETNSSNKDIIVIDDSSPKENKPELPIAMMNADSESVHKQNEKRADNTPSRKRKIETKLITPNKKNSPLLKFFQTAKNKNDPSKENVDENKANNKKISNNVENSKESTNVNVIEISDDESSDRCIDPKQDEVSSKIVKQELRAVKTDGAVEVDDSSTNSSSNDACNKGKDISIHMETTETNIDAKMQTDDDDTKGNVSKIQIGEKQDTENEENFKTVASNSNKGTEKASTSKARELPIKAVTPKASRRIALVTLSSPKRKKKV